MKTFREWAQDKPLLLTIFSGFAGVSIDDIFDHLQMLGEPEELEKRLSQPPSDQWLALYKDEYAIEEKVVDLYKTFGESGKSIAEVYKGAVTLVREPQLIQNYKEAIQDLSEEEIAQLMNISKGTKELFDLSSEDLESFLDDEDITVEVKTQFNSALQEPEFIFYMRVVIPCLLLYQENPCSLFRKARAGRIDAITKLLKVDKSVLQDDIIFKHYIKAARKEKVIDFNLFNRALRQEPADKLTVKTLKIAAAKFIWQLAEFFGYRITAPDIRDLFDIIMRRKSKGAYLVDEDLQETPDSFYKAVKRYPDFDTIFPPKSDKK